MEAAVCSLKPDLLFGTLFLLSEYYYLNVKQGFL